MTIKSEQLCECGCGQRTNLGPNGEPRRFIRGHNRRGKGNGWIEQGRRFVSIAGKKLPEHRFLMQQHLGRTLRSNEVVHHVDFDRLNNNMSNLVVLDRAEHSRLHAISGTSRPWTPAERERAIELYEAGMTVDEVALALGRPYISTAEWLRRAGATRLPEETRRMRQAA